MFEILNASPSVEFRILSSRWFSVTDRPITWKRWLVLAVNAAILLGVSWGLWIYVSRYLADLQTWETLWGRIRWPLLPLAGFLYLLGLFPCAAFWRGALSTLGYQPSWLATARAYYIGHLGKYIPSKAMVVFLRVWMLQGRVPAAPAGIAVFLETLTMMAVGGVLAGGLLAAFYREHLWLAALGVGLAAAAAVPILPPVLAKLAALARVGQADPELVERLELLTLRKHLPGVLGIAGGWFLMGLSLTVTITALDPSWSVGLGEIILCTAGVGLSVVAGFLSLLPGGVGVREVVLMPVLLTATAENAVAVAAAILLRLVWLLSEAVISAILYLCGGWNSPPPK